MSDREELIPINIVVADRSFRLKIKPEEEESIRKRMKEVNSRIVEFKTSFAGKDMQDYISMCLIWYATQEQGSGRSSGENEETQELLKRMELQMDEVLRESL